MQSNSFQKSKKYFEEAKRILPGGVNSPVRACQAVDSFPRFIQHAKGATLTDVDGHSYIDYVLSFGPMLLGHAHPKIVSAIQTTASQGTSFGAPTQNETRLAEGIKQFFPSFDKIRFVNSGTEATMSAVRLARGITSRDTLIKFDGCYHGHGDAFLVKAGSGSLTLGLPDSRGVPASVAKHTLSIPFNDMDSLKNVFKENEGRIAAVILEPVVGNMGVILPVSGFLETIRNLCDQHDCLLIFDEVMTGFRVASGSCQATFGVEPDLTCLGKVIGGGLPVGAFAGKSKWMDQLAPLGPIYQAGTLSGNPLVMAAGIATLKAIREDNHLEKAIEACQVLTQGLQNIAQRRNGDVQVVQFGTLFSIFFNASPVRDYASAKRCNGQQFKKFYHGMLAKGIYLAPSPYEAGFLSSAHSTSDLDKTLDAASSVLKTL